MGGDRARRSPRQPGRAHGESWGFINVDVIVNIKLMSLDLNSAGAISAAPLVTSRQPEKMSSETRVAAFHRQSMAMADGG